ncbi:MAG: beta-ketoacyl-[acyl-carrier-protein] synthase family protein [Bdellovibrionales bacterium]|nr:beta-ketoacyl-[acyl-carrier-protein] synthase family protein [Bdellovibrionales bacterium]
MALKERIVITGVGLTSPNGNNLQEFRHALLNNVSGVQKFETRHMGEVLAGVCDFDELKYQKRKERRRGTRAGSISIYCGHELFRDAGLLTEESSKLGNTEEIGVYIGITEHGNVETENEVWNLGQFDNDPKYWSHHHNPRTVANNPAGELCLNLGIVGPHMTVGAACAAGNYALISAIHALTMGDIKYAVAGGVSEAIHTFGIFASFNSQGALATLTEEQTDPTKASRPFDKNRNGIVCSEGGCLYLLETYDQAIARGAKIYAEIVGYGVNTDATDFVLPNSDRQIECMQQALKRADLTPDQIDIVNAHATGTPLGDEQEARAIQTVFGDFDSVHINATKGFIGHCMGAAGALELAGNLPAFEDGFVHPTMNFEEFDDKCRFRGLVSGGPKKVDDIQTIANMSSGMLGINTVIIVKKLETENHKPSNLFRGA